MLAQSLLCTSTDSTGLCCGQCQSCLLVQAGTHPDLFRLEKEEGSKVVKVDDLREFNRKIFLTPQLERGNVGIIDPVDDLNRSSANALLKSLEEPPHGSHILLVGERWMSLSATLRSRCLTVRFPLPPDSAVVRQWLANAPADTAILKRMRERYQPDTTKQQDWLLALTAVCLGKEDPILLAERWQKLGEELPDLLDWMYGCVVYLLKLKTQSLEAQKTEPNSVSEKSHATLTNRLSTSSLLNLAKLTIETRRLLDSQAKPQMLLENMLASWYQGSQSVSAHKTHRIGAVT
jgi:DNA polymerase-3 subunit delta'